jgi:hypothetical protein
MRLGKIKSYQSFTYTYTNQTTSWLVRNGNIFGAKTSHKETRIHKTHHGLDLGEAITFPLIIYFVVNHGTNIQMAFFLGLPNGSLKIPKVGTSTTLGAHNFVCRPLIEMRFKTKL